MNQKIKREFHRGWPFVLVAGLMLAPDPGALMVIGYAIGIISLAVILMHAVRKILLPYIDMEVLLQEVIHDRNVAAAIVIASTVALMGIIMNGLTTLLR